MHMHHSTNTYWATRILLVLVCMRWYLATLRQWIVSGDLCSVVDRLVCVCANEHFVLDLLSAGHLGFGHVDEVIFGKLVLCLLIILILAMFKLKNILHKTSFADNYTFPFAINKYLYQA